MRRIAAPNNTTNMNTKHTPGPWRQSTVNPCSVNKGGGKTAIGITTTHGTDDQNYTEFFPSKDEAEANARLIAAAPELLGALETLTEQAERAGWNGMSVHAARAAIAKATGETI